MRTLIDRYYRHLRPYRFLYGWALDAMRRTKGKQRATTWAGRNFEGAKLDICGGRNPYKPGEYLNVDIAPLPKVDLVFDITKKFPIPDGVIEEVLSVATLEHLRHQQVDHVLREFHRILKTGGMVRVSTPDLEAIARQILNHGDLAMINQHLFGKFKGDETEDLDLHKWMYPAPAMIEKLQEIGFTRVEQIPMDIGLHDGAWNYLIRGYKG